MYKQFKLGDELYYVPKRGKQLARYVRVTRIHGSLSRPFLTLGDHIVIAPRVNKNGNVAKDHIGGFWLSKEAFEIHQAYWSRPFWRRMRLWAISKI